MNRVAKYFPSNYTPQKMQDTIFQLLDRWLAIAGVSDRVFLFFSLNYIVSSYIVSKVVKTKKIQNGFEKFKMVLKNVGFCDMLLTWI